MLSPVSIIPLPRMEVMDCTTASCVCLRRHAAAAAELPLPPTSRCRVTGLLLNIRLRRCRHCAATVVAATELPLPPPPPLPPPLPPEDVLRPAHRVESETRPWQAVDTQGGRCDAGAALAVRGQSVVEDSKRGRQRQGRPCREEKMGEPREVEGGEEGGSNNATLTSGSR